MIASVPFARHALALRANRFGVSRIPHALYVALRQGGGFTRAAQGPTRLVKILLARPDLLSGPETFSGRRFAASPRASVQSGTRRSVSGEGRAQAWREGNDQNSALKMRLGESVFALCSRVLRTVGTTALGNDATLPRRAWRAYTSYDEACGFRRFLEISRVERAAEPKGFGREIRVAGEKAHWLGFDGQYVIFCRPGEAETF